MMLSFMDLGGVGVSMCCVAYKPFVEHPNPTLRIIGRVMTADQLSEPQVFSLLHTNLSTEDMP